MPKRISRSPKEVELEIGKVYEVHRIKPGRKRATRTMFTVLGFVDSPARGPCVEIDNGYGRRFIEKDKIKDAKEVGLKDGR